jgi:formylglycine-generating enzyme required for sulfatase activity
MKNTALRKILVLFLYLFLMMGCKNEPQSTLEVTPLNAPENMVWVAKKTFMQGAKDNDPMALPREKPAHLVTVDGFFIDKTEVTNAQFRKFVEATGYITIAERDIDWQEMRKNLPSGTPKPHDSILKSGCLVFNKQVNEVSNLVDYGQWWAWEIGAN